MGHPSSFVLIPQSTIAHIKSLVDIVEVVQDFVALKKSGSNYKGLSPFTEEKTPSFMVSAAKGIFKDFSSGKGGDAINFLMELEGYSYLEAVKYLGKKYGVAVEETEETPEMLAQRTEKDSLYIILDFAKSYYCGLLQDHDQGRAIGKSYFEERGFTAATIETFELGYSLDEWDGLLKAATAQRHSVEMLDKAGLLVRKEKEDKTYDRFRGRVMFPIHGVSGKVLGFGARTLRQDSKQPKYLNSPETLVYHKGGALYGIYQAKQAIRSQEDVYLVEGYTDVLSLHQNGIKNVVASSGTALTKGQINLLKRYTKRITVLYDGDPAGIRASLKGIDLILEEGMDVHAVTLPEGEDPDTSVRKMGSAAFMEHLKAAQQDFITFKLGLFLDEVQRDPLKKAEVINDVILSISKIPDAIKRTVFFQQCSQLLGVDETVLIAQYNKIALRERQQAQFRARQQATDVASSPNGHLLERLGEAAGTQKAAGDPSLTALTPEKTVDLEVQSVLEMEREMVRILLQFHDLKVTEEKINLGAFIIEEVGDVAFRDPAVKKVVAFFKAAIAADQPIQLQDLLHHEDQEIQRLSIDLTTQQHSVSDNWKQFHIYVKREQDDVETVVMRSIVRLKWRNVRLILKELETSLKTTTADQEILELQQKYVAYKTMETSFAKILGNVAVGKS